MKRTKTFPDIYHDHPYHFKRTEAGITIWKSRNKQKVLLNGDDETQFIIEYIFALQNGENITKLLSRYF